MGGGFGPTVALPLLHLHCEREREGEGMQSVFVIFTSLILCKYSCYKDSTICKEILFFMYTYRWH